MVTRSNRISSPVRRHQILGIAAQLFARKGFRGTTTREIAGKAHMNEAILFRHFPHKENLYWAVVEEKCQGAQRRKELRQMLNTSPPREALARVAEGILRRSMADPTLTRLLFYTSLESRRLSHRFFRTHVVRYYDVLADFIRAQIRRGRFRPVDPHLAARGFLGMIAHHFQIQELFGGKRYQRFDPREVSETLADIWLGGMTPRNGKQARRALRSNQRAI